MDTLLDIVQNVLIGLSVGAVISVGSVGMTLSYGVMKFPNIAHGYTLTLAMYMSLTAYVIWNWNSGPLGPFNFGWSLLLIGLGAAVLTGLLAMAVDLLVFRVIRNRGFQPIAALVASIGVAIVLRAVIQALWGTGRESIYSGVVPSLELPGGLRLHADAIFAMGVAVVVAGLLYVLLYHTRFGKAMRATAENPALAETAGIDTDRIRLLVWFVSGFLAGLAGLIYVMAVGQIFYNVGFTFLLPIIAAVILGGIGNPWGALLGGVLIGVSQEVSTLWIPSGYKEAVPFAVLILVLLLRPQGLLGRKEA